jgi:hypothetical protein
VESAVRDVSGHLLESDDEILTSLDMLIEAGRPRPEAFPSEKPQTGLDDLITDHGAPPGNPSDGLITIHSNPSFLLPLDPKKSLRKGYAPTKDSASPIIGSNTLDGRQNGLAEADSSDPCDSSDPETNIIVAKLLRIPSPSQPIYQDLSALLNTSHHSLGRDLPAAPLVVHPARHRCPLIDGIIAGK